MAVEDGAVICHLLESLCGALPSGSDQTASEHDLIPPLLKLYKRLRKFRTTVNVRSAVANRTFFHPPDGLSKRGGMRYWQIWTGKSLAQKSTQHQEGC